MTNCYDESDISPKKIKKHHETFYFIPFYFISLLSYAWCIGLRIRFANDGAISFVCRHCMETDNCLKVPD